MDVSEIYAKLSAHMIQGIMAHEKLANYYDFLNLRGYKRAHEYHMAKESKAFRKLNRYYINHFDRLIEEEPVPEPDIIPASWYRYTRHDVDPNTKRQAVKNGIDKWVAWEEKTKQLYESMYYELMAMRYVAAAEELACCIREVDKELKYAYRKQIELESVDYDLTTIIFEQTELHDKYKCKMEHLMEHLHDKH